MKNMFYRLLQPTRHYHECSDLAYDLARILIEEPNQCLQTQLHSGAQMYNVHFSKIQSSFRVF